MADAPLYQIRRVMAGGTLLGFTVYQNGVKGIFFNTQKEAENWIHEDYLRSKPQSEEVVINFDLFEGKLSVWN